MTATELAARRCVDAWSIEAAGRAFRFASRVEFADGSPPFEGEDAGEIDDDGRIAVLFVFARSLRAAEP